MSSSFRSPDLTADVRYDRSTSKLSLELIESVRRRLFKFTDSFVKIPSRSKVGNFMLQYDTLLTCWVETALTRLRKKLYLSCVASLVRFRSKLI